MPAKSNEILIVGAGGLAIQVMDVAQRLGYSTITFYDDITAFSGKPELLGYPILRSTAEVKEKRSVETTIVLAIAKPAHRKMIWNKFEQAGLYFQNLISSSALIGRYDLVTGEGTVVLESVSIESTVKIGKGGLLNTACRLFHGVQVGDYCEIAPGALLLGNVHIGNEVFIGANATLLPGIRVGHGAVIGAGTVVTKDVPEGALVKGVAGK